MADSSPNAQPRSPRRGNLIVPPTDERDAMPVRRRRPQAKPHKPVGWLAYLTLILLTIGSYSPIFNSGLIWSNYDSVERSPYQSMERWTQAWSPETVRTEDPITLSSYFLEQKIPLPPAVTHHAINLLLHLTAVILLLKVLEALQLPAAFSASLVFALHPAVLQTIFWSGYRHELVGLILLLAALLFGTRHKRMRDFYYLLLASTVAFAIHPGTLVLPLILALCIFYQKASFQLKDYNRILPVLCLSLFIGVWTHGSYSEVELALNEQIRIYAQNLYFYLKQSLLPVELALFHPFEQSISYNVGSQNNFLPFLLFIPFYVLIAIYYKNKWARGIFLGLTAYILLVIYGLLQAGAFIDGSPAQEDHFLYISLPVMIALVICSAGGIIQNLGAGGKILWFLGFTMFVVLQLAITASYADNVSNRAQMWHTLSKQWPNNWLPKLALIDTIQETDAASDLLTRTDMIEMLEQILEKQPDQLEERMLLARIYRDEGQNTNALRHFKRILRDTTPDNDFLREAAEFYDKLGLSWDANNARERIIDSSDDF